MFLGVLSVERFLRVFLGVLRVLRGFYGCFWGF